MDIIVTQEQLENIIPQEHKDFVKSFYEKTGHFPEYRDLQYGWSGYKVSNFVPNHPNGNINLKTYVENYIGRYLKSLRVLYSDKLDISPEKPKLGTKRIFSLDKKELLRSTLEALTYNTFILEGIQNEIEVDSNKFLKSCKKIPDFVWETKKIIIEVAGLESEEYKNKLSGAEKCFQDLGYNVIILNARAFEKNNKYIEFYKYLCEKLGFTPKQKVLESPYKYLGFSEITKQDKLDYIKANIQKFPKDRKTSYTLNKYISQIYGYGVKEYIENIGLKRFNQSVNKKDIVNFKKENPTMSNSEIAKHFGVHKNTVQTATKGMGGKKNQN